MHNEPVGKQKLIEPIIINDDIYLQNWLNADYKTNAYHHEECVYETRQGELVRSKSEAMLVDMYFNLGVPYLYECGVDIGFNKTKYLDFTLLDVKNRKEIYREHMRLLDDEFYREHNLRKINEYRHAGIYPGKNLIITHEAVGSPFNIRDIEKMIIELFDFPYQ